MKIRKYLNEEDWFDLDEMLDLIEKDCKPFLKDWKRSGANDFLYTGRKNLGEFEKRKVRKNREPKDTPVELHHLVDKWFHKKFGIKARSNVVFCTFDVDEVYRYGDPYFVFPIGKYKAISSPMIQDLFLTMQSESYHTKDIPMAGFSFSKNGFKDLDKLPDIKQKVIDNIIKKMEKSKYTDKLIVHQNEIMLWCKEYYLVSDEYGNNLLKRFQ